MPIEHQTNERRKKREENHKVNALLEKRILGAVSKQ